MGMRTARIAGRIPPTNPITVAQMIPSTSNSQTRQSFQPSRETGSSTRGRPDYRMTFEYSAADGTMARLTTRTNRPERLEDHPQELLLYDPQTPANAFLIDDLPGSVTIDESGQPTPSGGSHLTLPVLTLLGNGWFVYRHWIAG